MKNRIIAVASALLLSVTLIGGAGAGLTAKAPTNSTDGGDGGLWVTNNAPTRDGDISTQGGDGGLWVTKNTTKDGDISTQGGDGGLWVTNNAPTRDEDISTQGGDGGLWVI